MNSITIIISIFLIFGLFFTNSSGVLKVDIFAGVNSILQPSNDDLHKDLICIKTNYNEIKDISNLIKLTNEDFEYLQELFNDTKVSKTHDDGIFLKSDKSPINICFNIREEGQIEVEIEEVGYKYQYDIDTFNLQQLELLNEIVNNIDNDNYNMNLNLIDENRYIENIAFYILIFLVIIGIINFIVDGG